MGGRAHANEPMKSEERNRCAPFRQRKPPFRQKEQIVIPREKRSPLSLQSLPFRPYGLSLVYQLSILASLSDSQLAAITPPLTNILLHLCQ